MRPCCLCCSQLLLWARASVSLVWHQAHNNITIPTVITLHSHVQPSSFPSRVPHRAVIPQGWVGCGGLAQSLLGIACCVVTSCCITLFLHWGMSSLCHWYPACSMTLLCIATLLRQTNMSQSCSTPHCHSTVASLWDYKSLWSSLYYAFLSLLQCMTLPGQVLMHLRCL